MTHFCTNLLAYKSLPGKSSYYKFSLTKNVPMIQVNFLTFLFCQNSKNDLDQAKKLFFLTKNLRFLEVLRLFSSKIRCRTPFDPLLKQCLNVGIFFMSQTCHMSFHGLLGVLSRLQALKLRLEQLRPQQRLWRLPAGCNV